MCWSSNRPVSSSNKQRMRVALIGAGPSCAPHLQSLMELAPAVELAWVAARTPAPEAPEP